MKATWKIIVSLCFFYGVVFSISAQSYTPTTKWPYIYEEFQDGTVYFQNDQKTKTMKLNVHLQNSTLHYLDGNSILQSNPRGIEKVQIGNDTFIYMNGLLVHQLSSLDNVALVKLTKADFKALTKGTTGAYGMSTEVSATNDLSSIQLSGSVNLNHTQMKLERSEGKDLPLINEYYFIFGDKVVEATRKDVEKSLGEDGKTKLKAFVKQNKIKWKDEVSLIKLLEFFQQ